MLTENEWLKPKAFQDDLRQTFSVVMDKRVTIKAVSKARKERSREDALFGKLPPFFDALKAANPGTIAEVAFGNGRFSMAFLCPGPCARAWRFCLNVIVLDAAHGTSKYNGIVLSATALDSAGQIFPIAIGFASNESVQSWRFFIGHIADALGIRDTDRSNQ
mgnify:CR=1 FL=1